MDFNTNQQRKNILWLASWYPNKEDRFTGDFIQRHAHAAALLNHIYVLHVAPSQSISASAEETINYSEALTEHIIYYRQPTSLLGQLTKQISWFRLYKKAIEAYIQQNGLPKAVHVHVVWKAGLLALWLKWRFNLPYVITEHWGMYNRVVKDNFFQKPFAVQQSIKQIFRQSAHLATVSYFIASTIKGWMKMPNVTLTPNVVDTNFFQPSAAKHSKFTLLHVSTLVSLKNVKGILDAFRSLSSHDAYAEMELVIIGNRDKTYVEYAQAIGISEKVSFKGEIAYYEVADEMKKCHCLIVNSIMENAPCVISEAHCCGLPVIATNVGGIPEMVDATNGILIPPENNDELAKGILNIFQHYNRYQPDSIASLARAKYAYPVVAAQFDQIYSSL